MKKKFKLTKKDKDVFRRMGKLGGPARARNMTPEERSEQARNAVLSRWNKEDKTKK